jgi:HEAT repeat protein
MRVAALLVVLALCGRFVSAATYYVTGEGANTGVYQFEGDKIDVRQAMTAAGFDLKANPDKVIVLVRRWADGRDIIQPIPVADLLNKPDDPKANPPLQADDVLIVRPAPPMQPVDPAREKMQRLEEAVRTETDRVKRALDANKPDDANAHIAEARTIIDEAEKSTAEAPGIEIYGGMLREGLSRTERALANDDLDGARLLAQNDFNPGNVFGGNGPWFRVRMAQPRQFIRDITQRRDKDLRQRTLDGLLKTLGSGKDANSLADALAVFPSIKDVPFDRAPYLKASRAHLGHDSPEVRTHAMAAVSVLGGDASDVPAIAALAKDKNHFVRGAVAGALYAVAGPNPGEQVFAAVDTLLDDYLPSVQHATVQALWGHPVSTASEKKLIEFSRLPAYGGPPSALTGDALYYALSTRPVVSPLVADRLIELMQEGKQIGADTGRATWGLTHHTIAPEARDKVVKALIDEFDETVDEGRRGDLIFGLGRIGGDVATAKLKAISESDESDRTRKNAADALYR